MLAWVGFFLLVGTLLALDLGVFHKSSHQVRFREAVAWTCVWVTLAMLFNIVVYFLYESGYQSYGGVEDRFGVLQGKTEGGWDAVLKYFTGYIVEESLSIDNIFVMAVILASLRVPPEVQHRVLFWGIMGALVLRGIMIGVGTVLVEKFDWMMYVFGGLLIVSAIKLFLSKEDAVHVEHSFSMRLARKLFRVTHEFHGKRFFVRVDGKLTATPLFLALVLVEATDVVFAVDSVPAVFAVTTDPFIVYTSNVFAILGLRSLYFVLAGMMDRFRYLKYSLILLLGYVGMKMILAHHVKIPNGLSLGIIGAILLTGVLASVLAPVRHEENESAHDDNAHDDNAAEDEP